MSKIQKVKSKGSLWYFLRHFNKKHRISVRDQRNDREVWYMYSSSLRLTLAAIGVFVIIAVAVIALIVYTPILDMLPGNPGRKSRELITENIVRIDSLHDQLAVMQEYSNSIREIMEGRTPAIPTVTPADDGVETDIVPASAADSLLRLLIESMDGRYSLVTETSSTSSRIRGMGFIPPVTGRVTTPFDPQTGFNGIGVSLLTSQQVLAIQEGTVISAMWTPEDGYVVMIQHKDNFISIYKHNSQLMKMTGDRVNSGEAVGYVDVDSQLSDSGNYEFVFELWYDGQPIDPQKYIFIN